MFNFALRFCFIFSLCASARATEPGPAGCTSLIENFCKELHSPARQGHWDLKLGDTVLKIRRGLTENDFSYPYYRGYQLMLERKGDLPKELVAELVKKNYFEQGRRFLNAKPYSQHTVNERAEDFFQSGKLDSIFQSAFKAVVMRKLEKLHPGYSKMRTRDRPPAWLLEEKQLLADLKIDTNRARWLKSPEWQQAQAQFEEVRGEIIQLVKQLKSASPEARSRFEARLRATTLLSPGTTEDHLDDGCVDDLDNAFYNSRTNSVQICAGLLTSTSALFTVAHELAHTLDPVSIVHEDRTRSAFGKSVEELKATQCSGKSYSCENWKKLKDGIKPLVAGIPIFRPDPESFFQCFQKRDLTAASGSYLTDHVKRWMTDDLESLSRNSDFIKLIKKEAELLNGKSYPNPAYLNPCGLDDWNRSVDEYPVNTITPILLFFTAEYSCSAHLPAAERFRNAIETAKKLQLEFTRRFAEQAGKYSSDARLASDGHAEDVGERVADTIGSEAVARILAKTKSLEGRRMLFFSMLADRCDTPSWKTRHPLEAAVENEFSWDPHTQGLKRLFESLPASVREQIQCEKDFELKECPFN